MIELTLMGTWRYQRMAAIGKQLASFGILNGFYTREIINNK